MDKPESYFKPCGRIFVTVDADLTNGFPTANTVRSCRRFGELVEKRLRAAFRREGLEPVVTVDPYVGGRACEPTVDAPDLTWFHADAVRDRAAVIVGRLYETPRAWVRR